MMKTSRKAISIILGLVMCISILTSCGSSTNSAAKPSGSTAPPSANSSTSQTSPSAELPKDAKVKDHMEVIIDSSISVINPLVPAGGGGAGNNNASLMIYETLVRNDTGALAPCLAKSWDTSDWKTITFHLRDDVYFHNGDKFNAQSVVDYLALVKKAAGTNPNTVYKPIETATATGEYTVEFKLNAVNVEFLDSISLAACGILDAKAIAKDPEKGSWIGTGPYAVSEFATNDHISFARNDKYWGKPAVTKTQTWRSVPEMSTRTIMLQKGDADFCWSIPETDIPFFKKDPKFAVLDFISPLPNTIMFNMKNPITGDKNFRLAVASVIKRDEILLASNGGNGVPETDGTLWGYKQPNRDTDIPMIPYDLAKAKKYLAASSYKGEELEITTSTPTNVKAAEALQQQLSVIGIKTSIKNMDTPSFLAYTSGIDKNGQIMLWPLSMGYTAGSLKLHFYPGQNNNKAKYDNPEVSKLIDQTSAIVDEKERAAVLKQIQELIAKDIPYISTYYTKSLLVGCKGFGGLNWFRSFNDLSHAYVITG